MRKAPLLRSAWLCLLLSASLAVARSWSSNELPNPQDDPGGVCRRHNVKSAVCDPDGYMSKSDSDTIDGLINFINKGEHGFKKLDCPGGSSGPQIAVAIVESMSFGFGDKKDRAFKFAKDLHDRWGVGDAHCQNGIVLFFAVKNRAMGFSIGRGVKGIITLQYVHAIMSNVGVMLRNKEYGPAVIEGVTEVGNLLSGAPPPHSQSSGGPGPEAFVFLFFMSAAGVAALSSWRSRRRYNRCKKVLQKIDQDRSRASQNGYVSTSCPICLEDFNAPTESPSPGNEGTSAGVDDLRDESEKAKKHDPSSPPKESVVVSASARASAADEKPSVRTRTMDSDVSEAQPFIERTANEMTVAESEDSTQTVRTLPCGHMFHGDCITSWVSSQAQASSTCPICRQPIVSEEGVVVENRTNRGLPSGWNVYDDEYAFRVRRAQYYYPDYITFSMINSWERDRYNRNEPMATSATFTAVDPVVVAAAARASGSGGSSFSFGGGSSGGGGGGGGGW